MKKILSIALLLSGISFATMAQDAPKKIKEGRKHNAKREMIQKSPEEIAKFRTERLDKEVKLSDKQRQEVYALQLNDAKANQKSVESRRKSREVNQENRKVSRAQLNKILTPEQQEIMSNRMAKQHDKGINKREGGKKRQKDGSRTERRQKIESPTENSSNS